MIVIEKADLRNLHTFHTQCIANKMITIESLEEVNDVLKMTNNQEFLFLGGGSNLLFADDYSGVVIHPGFKEISVIKEDKNQVLLSAEAGVEWDQLVAFAVQNNWGGMENLSLIPGNVGASPIQNIGAYGVEAKDVIEWVEGVDIQSGEKLKWISSECDFGYRSSIFKYQLKGKVLITKVIYKLTKQKHHFNLGYGQLESEVLKFGECNLKNVRSAVISIRKSKLPDPDILGNAGSFFKNPIVDRESMVNLLKILPNLPVYNSENEMFKLSAAYLIDKAGWKGKRIGDAGVHLNQPLVLVNYGNANGKNLMDLALMIQNDVQSKYKVELEPEVNLI